MKTALVLSKRSTPQKRVAKRVRLLIVRLYTLRGPSLVAGAGLGFARLAFNHANSLHYIAFASLYCTWTPRTRAAHGAGRLHSRLRSEPRARNTLQDMHASAHPRGRHAHLDHNAIDRIAARVTDVYVTYKMARSTYSNCHSYTCQSSQAPPQSCTSLQAQ